MKKILIVGGGAMGSAFSIPCLENNNKVIITEPHNKVFIKDLASKKKFHSSLKVNLPKKLKFTFLKDETLLNTVWYSILPKTINIVKIPKANPKSPMRFTINALIAAAFAVGFLYQNPINK